MLVILSIGIVGCSGITLPDEGVKVLDQQIYEVAEFDGEYEISSVQKATTGISGYNDYFCVKVDPPIPSTYSSFGPTSRFAVTRLNLYWELSKGEKSDTIWKTFGCSNWND
jgi:hypothetical protein